MQELKSPDIEKLYKLDEALKQLSVSERSTLTPVKVQVQEDPHKLTITLSIGAQNLVLSIDQAKDLAFEIKKAANRMNNIRLEKEALKKRHNKL